MRATVQSSLAAGLAAVVLASVACSSFHSDAPAAEAPSPEGGDAGAEAAALLDGGVVDSPAAEGSAPAVTVTLASGYAQLHALAATETDVFFSDEASGKVWTVPIVGGTSARLLASSGAPASIAVAGGGVYWADTSGYAVKRADILTGSVTSTPTTVDEHVSMLASTSDRIFGMVGNNGGVGALLQYGLDLAPMAGATLDGLTNPFALTSQGNTAYWTEGSPSEAVRSLDEGSSTPVTIGIEHDAQSITADDAGLYWARPIDQLIRGRLNNGPLITLASGEPQPYAIAADGTYVYWTTSNNELRRAGHLDNGTSSLVASGFTRVVDEHVRAIAVTKEYIVWLTEDGKVLRLHK